MSRWTESPIISISDKQQSQNKYDETKIEQQ